MWRHPTANPFEPGHDVVPPVWAGRQAELYDWERLVRPRRLIGQYERGRALLGEPGIGKSVLAAKISEMSEEMGDIVVPSVRIPRGSDVLALLAQALTDTVHTYEIGAAVGDRISALLGRVRSVAHIEVAAAPRPANPHTHLRDLLIELGRYAATRNKVVYVHLDEVQNVNDEDALSQLLVALGDAIRHTEDVRDAAGTVHRKVLPIITYITGLSEFTDRATTLAGATFARRFKPVRLTHLDDDELREAMAPFTSTQGWPVLDQDAGVAMTDGAVDAMLAFCLGDPFLFQLIGKAAWDAAPDEQVITTEHVVRPAEDVTDEARSHVNRLLARLPEREREFVDAMASLAPSRRTASMIARKLGRTTNQLGSAAQRLEERGVIRRGKPYTFRARTVEGLVRGQWPPTPA